MPEVFPHEYCTLGKIDELVVVLDNLFCHIWQISSNLPYMTALAHGRYAGGQSGIFWVEFITIKLGYDFSFLFNEETAVIFKVAVCM